MDCSLQGFAVPKESQSKVVDFSFHGTPAQIKHGDVVIAAITSCTNTSNPSVMLGAALVAKKACELGLEVKLCHLYYSLLGFGGQSSKINWSDPFGCQLLGSIMIY